LDGAASVSADVVSNSYGIRVSMDESSQILERTTGARKGVGVRIPPLAPL
jgi:hypothetical protein